MEDNELEIKNFDGFNNLVKNFNKNENIIKEYAPKLNIICFKNQHVTKNTMEKILEHKRNRLSQLIK
jgi:hypothetical protein